MTGNMVDSCHPNQLNEIGKWHKPWFFKHVEEKLHNGQDTEYIPIRDYYHRHSRYVCSKKVGIRLRPNSPAFNGRTVS